MHRTDTKPVKVGKYIIGGNNDIVIQSMTNTDTCDIEATLQQINDLKKAGCHIVRLAVPTEEAAFAFREIKSKTDVPLVADIHFNHRLALICIEAGADKVRINPGNIGSEDRVKEVVLAAKAKNTPIRIGINGGSLPKDIQLKFGNTAEAMVEAAAVHINILNRYDFDDIIVSIKSSDVCKTVEACRLFSQRYTYPLHLGVTEAGTVSLGTVKSAVGIGSLLVDGIGSTIRVSITGDPVNEIIVAKQILKSVGLYDKGVNLISCPTCGRCKIDIEKLASKVERYLADVEKSITVAVMGCVVNGPGEAKEADIGIAGGDGYAMIFKKGEQYKKVKESEIFDTLIEEINKL